MIVSIDPFVILRLSNQSCVGPSVSVSPCGLAIYYIEKNVALLFVVYTNVVK